MKILRWLVSYFYAEERRDSQGQLENDFGEFPPRPLGSRALETSFVVARLRGIGTIYPSILLIRQILKYKCQSEVPAHFGAAFQNLSSARENFKTVRQQVRDTANSGLGGLLAAGLMICSLVLLLPYLLVRILLSTYRIYKNRIKSKGYFLPLFSDENRVMLQTGGCREEEEVIITHEHLHLLQNKHNGLGGKTSRCGPVLLEKEMQSNHFLLYLMEKNELEARLHEMVIDYYRKNKALPTTLAGFIDLLASSCELGPEVAFLVGFSGEEGTVQYEHRSKDIAEQIAFVLACVKDDVLRRRIISEVLPVMYGNLLRYYGDVELSNSFLRALPRPNLYDVLYGEAPVDKLQVP